MNKLTATIANIQIEIRTNFSHPTLSSLSFPPLQPKKMNPPIIFRIIRKKKRELGQNKSAQQSIEAFKNQYPGCILSHSPFLLEEAVQDAIKKSISRKEESSFILNDILFFTFRTWERAAELLYLDRSVEKRLKDWVFTVCMQFFPLHDSIFFHSSGVIRKGRALIFCGPSQSGKTTVARMAGNTPILSDDQVAAKLDNGKFFAHATPFGQMVSGPLQAEIGSIFFLKQGKRFSLRPLSDSEALKRAWFEHRDFLQFTLPDTRRQIFFLMDRLFSSAQSYEMEFTRDYIDWEQLEGCLSKGKQKIPFPKKPSLTCL